MNNLSSLAIQPNVYYTADEAAHLLRVSQNAMMKLLQSKQTAGIKIEKQWRILGAALLDLSSNEDETEPTLVADWLQASASSLSEVWDNEEDAVYDKL